MSQAAADRLAAEAHQRLTAHDHAGAAAGFERAIALFPQHAWAWKGLGQALLHLGQVVAAARAFDRAIGLGPGSATALWGGALAHAQLGHTLVARSYLDRVLAAQPTWIEMVHSTPVLAGLLTTAARTSDLLRQALGPGSSRAYRHATDSARSIEVMRFADVPERGVVTYASLGLSDMAWPDGRPRIEIVLAADRDGPVPPSIVANAAFHVMDRPFYPVPGTVVRDLIGVLDAGDLSRRLPHLYFTVPRPWGLRLPLDEGPPAITIAMAVPVSEAEYRHWKAHGHAAFEARLAAADLADLDRDGR